MKCTLAGSRYFGAKVFELLRADGTNIAAGGRLFTVSTISFTPAPPGSTQAQVTAEAYSQGAPTVAATGATGTTTTAAATTP